MRSVVVRTEGNEENEGGSPLCWLCYLLWTDSFTMVQSAWFLKSERPVAHDSFASARSVAGIPQIDTARSEAAPAGQMQQATNRAITTSLFGVQECAAQTFDDFRCRPISRSRSLVIVIVAQVRTDDDARLGSAPKRGEHFGDFFVARVTDQQRHQSEPDEKRLQKRQVHFETVFRLVRLIKNHHLRQETE